MRTKKRGQSVVEFALVAPIFFGLVYGIIAAGWLFFQASAVNDAAQGGTREAIVVDYLGAGLSLNGSGCATGLPETIPQAVQHAANILTVNQNPLCEVSYGASFCPASGGNALLVQTPISGEAAIQLCVVGGVGSASAYAVKVTYLDHRLAPLLGASIHLQSISTLNAQGT